MATEQTITISGTPTVVSGVTVPYTLSSDLEIYIGKGLVEKVVLDNAGAGYADATNAALEFSGGGGSSAALTVDVANGQVSLDNLGVPTNKGTGYTTSPIVGFGNLTSGTGASATAEIYAKKTSGTDYTLSGSSGSTTITFTSALADGDKVLIKRVTGVSTAINTFSAGSSITAADLNKSFDQLRYKAEELPDIKGTVLTNGIKDDINVSGNNWTILDNAVNTAKIANDAVDGNKLANNIDIAGTLDVTGNAIFDNNVNIKGDSKTFTIEQADGTDKFTVASSTGNTTIAGTLGVTGVTTFSSDVTITDNDKLYAGTHGDIEIYHDAIGGHSYIKGLGTGNLRFTSDADIYVQKNTGGTTLGVFKPGTTTVDLYAGGTKRFETTTNGVYVTGQVDITTNINVNTNKFQVNGATGNTLIAGTLTTAAQKAVTIGGPLILSKVSKDVTGLTTLALHATDNTGSNILNAAYLELSSSSGAVTLATITGGTEGQVLYITVTGSNDITLTNVNDTTANGFQIGGGNATYTLDASAKDTIVVIYNGSQWIRVGHGDN